MSLKCVMCLLRDLPQFRVTVLLIFSVLSITLMSIADAEQIAVVINTVAQHSFLFFALCGIGAAIKITMRNTPVEAHNRLVGYGAGCAMAAFTLFFHAPIAIVALFSVFACGLAALISKGSGDSNASEPSNRRSFYTFTAIVYCLVVSIGIIIAYQSRF